MIVGKHKEQDQKQPGERPSGSRTRLIRLVIMLPLLLILVSIIFLFTTNFIPSESMEPNLKPGDHILTLRKWAAYPFGKTPSRGDRVVFVLPDKESQNTPNPDLTLIPGKHLKGEILIKRIVGLPGDKVQFFQNQFRLNGQVVQEPYEIIKEDLETSGGFLYAVDSPFTVPPGEYFVMGDNRNNSDDGRVWGTLKPEWILGRYVRTLWNEGANGRNSKKAKGE